LLSAATFTARTIHAAEAGGAGYNDGHRVETGAFDLTPALEQGRSVCNVFAEFLSGAPGEFRERLPFLNKIDIEMQWAAASGGAAFYAFFHKNETIEMGVLAAGTNPEADQQIVKALLESVAEPMLGSRAREWMAMGERPLALRLRMPGNPELGPTMDLLAMALASVYFRAVFTLAAASSSAAGSPAGAQ
jgi:hypothetical protein